MNDDTSTPATNTDDEVLERLAGLDRLAYERARKPAAKELGVRVSVLDELVDCARLELRRRESEAKRKPAWAAA